VARSSRWSKSWKPAPPANETDGLVIHGPLIGRSEDGATYELAWTFDVRFLADEACHSLTPLQPSTHRPYAWEEAPASRVSQKAGFVGSVSNRRLRSAKSSCDSHSSLLTKWRQHVTADTTRDISYNIARDFRECRGSVAAEQIHGSASIVKTRLKPASESKQEKNAEISLGDIRMLSIFRRLMKSEHGATAIEYTLIASLIAVAAITAFTTVGNKVSNVMSNVASRMN
jgi:pilus assembly protein Flp/PilA